MDSLYFPRLDSNETWKLLPSKDGKYLLATSDSGRIRLFDIAKVMSKEDNEIQNDKFVTIYPNPATDFLDIQINKELLSPAKISIFDIFGKLIYNEISKNNFIHLSTAGFSQGTYFINVTSGSYSYFGKFVDSFAIPIARWYHTLSILIAFALSKLVLSGKKGEVIQFAGMMIFLFIFANPLNKKNFELPKKN